MDFQAISFLGQRGNMRKLVLLVLLIFSLLLSSCSNEGQTKLDPKDPIVISIWSYYNSRQKDIFDGFIQKFNETVGSEKGVIVEHKSYGAVRELAEALTEAVKKEGGAEKMPDIFIFYKGVARQIEHAQPLVDLYTVFTRDELGQFVEVFIEAGKYFPTEPEMKMMPIGKSTEFLMINSTTFDEYVKAGVLSYDDLETYESLLKASKKYYEYTDAQTEQLNDGKSLYGIDSVANYVFVSLSELGKDLVKMEGGKEVIELDRDSFKKLWDHYYVPFVKGYFGKRAKFTSEDVKTGHLLVSQGSSSSSTYFPASVVDDMGNETQIEAKILPIPHFEGTVQKCLVQGGGLFITNSTPQRVEASVEFIKWITNKENNTDFAIKCSYLPVRKDNFKKDSIEQSAQNGDIKENTKKVILAAIERLQNVQAYEPDPTEHYEQVRKLIEIYFGDYASDDRELVLRLMESGNTYEEAIATVLNKDRFNQWFNSLTREIEKVTSK